MFNRDDHNRSSLASALLLLALAGASIFSAPVNAQGFFALEPGKRIKGHAKYDCNKCHTEGEGVSRQKCLSCHDHQPLARRIQAGKGLHARKDYKKNCETCHAEHKGSKYNPIDWRPLGGQKKFSHSLTGYPLEGAHKKQSCKSCHTAKQKVSKRTTFLGLNSNCLSCHDDVHRFQNSHPELTDCKICHSQDARTVSKAKGLRFDHGRVADFKLKGKHNVTKCASCHVSTKIFKMKDPPKNCAQCHKDEHKNVYTNKGRDCKACHSDSKQSFEKGKFNHTKLTRFPVRNKHAKQKCTKCHQKTAQKPPALNCNQCHKKDSVHLVKGKDRFAGRDCIQCHNDTGFKSMVFNHKTQAKFTLGGKHKKISCTDCHRKKPKKQISVATDTFEKFKDDSCIGCHAHKEAHDKKFNDKPQLCVKCHIPGNTNIKTPDHSELSSHFAQQGAHKPVSCEKCHGEGLTKLKVGEDCSSCHKDDDAHKGNLGATCKDCHFEGYPWTSVIFDHNKKAEFPLEGKHQAVSCSKCHSSAPKEYKPLDKGCISCHSTQDVHEGALENDCAKCHTAEGGAALFDHNTMTDYVLEGSHARADCRGCHFKGDPDPTLPPDQAYVIDFKFEAQGTHCADCHGDPHGLRRGAQCLGCHDQESWLNVADSVGAGDVESKKTKTQSGKPNPNTSALGPGAKSVLDDAKGQLTTVGSKVRDHYHDQPPFNLRGGHSKLECFRCHEGRGDLQGFGKACDTCHRQDDIHSGSLGPRCSDCHSQNAFMPARFSHTQTGFSLVGAHRIVGCKNCHSAGNYMGVSGNCVSCHADDAARAWTTTGVNHTGFLSQACVNCHNQMTWLVTPRTFRRGF